jgi:hypothetical protein
MKNITKELEFEKSRMEILKLSGKNIQQNIPANHKKAWEYEYEEYKKQKKKEKLYLFGSICGILSLLLTLILNFDTMIKLF